MPQGWKPFYRLLTGYIESNPSIKVEPAVTAIPPGVRSDFYAIFDQTREAFIREYFDDELVSTEKLSREFRQLAGEVASLLNIQPEIGLNARLKWLMDDPLNGLMRLIYNPLFNLLKGKLNEEEFVHICHAEFDSVFYDLYHKGYNLWVILALLQLLEPSDLMWVPQKEPNAINSLKELYKQGARVEPVPDTTHTSLLTFEPGTWDTFIVPDIIFYSAKLDKYVAIRRSLPVNTDEPYLVAKQRITGKEWFSFRHLSSVFNLTNRWPDILIYCDKNSQNLNLIADYEYMLRPDIAIDTFTQHTAFTVEQGARIRSHRQHLKPSSKTVVLYQGNIPDEAVQAFSPDDTANPSLPATGPAVSPPDTPMELPSQQRGSAPEKISKVPATEDAVNLTLSTITLVTSGGFDRLPLSQIIDGLI